MLKQPAHWSAKLEEQIKETNFDTEQFGETTLETKSIIQIFLETYTVSSVRLGTDDDAELSVTETQSTGGDKKAIVAGNIKISFDKFIKRVSEWFKVLH